MKHLKYLPDHVWQRLPLADFRARFFVEAYCEKLRMYTPHFYQARLMNVLSSASEMLSHLEDYEASERGSAYVVCSWEELSECWNGDLVAQVIFSDLAALRSSTPKISATASIDSHTVLRLKGLGRAILARQETYAAELLSTLENSILGPADLSQRERLTNQIDRLTGLYVSYLLNKGFSPTYLYNRSEMFSRETNYSGRAFHEQFRHVTDRLRTGVVQFDVVYGLHTNKPSLLLAITGEPGTSFTESVPDEVQGSDLEKLRKNIDINIVMRSSLESTDYVSAALRTKDRLDQLLDATTASEPITELDVSSHCVVVYRGPTGARHTQAISTDLLLAFMTSEGGAWLPDAKEPMWRLLRMLNAPARVQLGRSLRYLRVARAAVSSEQKLLNLWIALESIFTGSDTNIISNILEYVPHLYATSALVRRVGYVKSLLIANKIAITPRAQSICTGQEEFDESVSASHVFRILRDEAAAIELFNSLGQLEHLKFKVKQVHSDLQDNKAISARISRSTEDVGRQLRRIYSVRNKIAHMGHYDGVRPQLVTHLIDYLAVCYWCIGEACVRAKCSERYSVAELLVAARLGSDVVVARVSGKDAVTTLDQLVPTPII